MGIPGEQSYRPALERVKNILGETRESFPQRREFGAAEKMQASGITTESQTEAF